MAPGWEGDCESAGESRAARSEGGVARVAVWKRAQQALGEFGVVSTIGGASERPLGVDVAVAEHRAADRRGEHSSRTAGASDWGSSGPR